MTENSHFIFPFKRKEKEFSFDILHKINQRDISDPKTIKKEGFKLRKMRFKIK